MKIILSYLQNYEYSIPSNKKQLLSDFYIYSFIKKLSAKDNASFQYFRDAENINMIIENVENILIPYLKTEMLNVVYTACCSEIFHIADEMYSYDGKYKKQVKEYISLYKKNLSAGDNIPGRIFLITSIFPNPNNLINFCIELFSNGRWKNSYGGQSWATIAKTWILLKNAKNDDDLIYIDHIIDLQHNSGSVFSKIEYYKQDGSLNWLNLFLTLKSNTNISILLNYCSVGMKKIAAYILNANGFSTYEKSQEEYKKHLQIEDGIKCFKDLPNNLFEEIGNNQYYILLIRRMHSQTLNDLDFFRKFSKEKYLLMFKYFSYILNESFTNLRVCQRLYALFNYEDYFNDINFESYINFLDIIDQILTPDEIQIFFQMTVISNLTILKNQNINDENFKVIVEKTKKFVPKYNLSEEMEIKKQDIILAIIEKCIENDSDDFDALKLKYMDNFDLEINRQSITERIFELLINQYCSRVKFFNLINYMYVLNKNLFSSEFIITKIVNDIFINVCYVRDSLKRVSSKLNKNIFEIIIKSQSFKDCLLEQICLATENFDEFYYISNFDEIIQIIKIIINDSNKNKIFSKDFIESFAIKIFYPNHAYTTLSKGFENLTQYFFNDLIDEIKEIFPHISELSRSKFVKDTGNEIIIKELIKDENIKLLIDMIKPSDQLTEIPFEQDVQSHSNHWYKLTGRMR